ncbi:2-C-methyl-D-erythritol 4-phosphate cytidylyltransferase [Clostridioides difficile]|nr:2-C-methyl-D-erythritol 4-phosphate cytidylyltransferase [Clostridioides difficile]
MIYGEILAGGKGNRMGNTEMPKQFLKLGDKPIIIHTLEKFVLCTKIDKIIIVVPKQWKQHTIDIIKKYIDMKTENRIYICEGGVNRNESIMNGIRYINNHWGINDDDIVVTHDSIRPFITNRIIEDNIKMCLKYHATDTVIPAFDTIVESENNDTITNIPVRNFMYQGQTPQSFNIKKLMDFYDSISEEEKEVLTDAAKIFVINGEKVRLVLGEVFNIKITTQFDLKLANALVKEGSSNDK